jgi:tetratricopeptide (TPR) repeat protein
MKSLVNIISVVIILVIAMIFAFRIHILLGIAFALLLVGYYIYRSRANFYALRGSNAYGKGDTEQAIIWFKKAYDSKPCPESHQISYGYILLRTGKAEQAEPLFQHLIRTTKSKDIRIQSQCNLATTYWLQAKKVECLELLAEVFEQYKNSLVYGNFGYFKILIGDVEAALAFNLEAYAYNSDDKTIIDNLAYNYYLLGQMDEAEEKFAQLIPKSPKFADPHYFYALTLEKQGKMEEAIEQIQIALNKDIAFITPITRAEVEQKALSWDLTIDNKMD